MMTMSPTYLLCLLLSMALAAGEMTMPVMMEEMEKVVVERRLEDMVLQVGRTAKKDGVDITAVCTQICVDKGIEKTVGCTTPCDALHALVENHMKKNSRRKRDVLGAILDIFTEVFTIGLDSGIFSG